MYCLAKQFSKLDILSCGLYQSSHIESCCCGSLTALTNFVFELTILAWVKVGKTKVYSRI